MNIIVPYKKILKKISENHCDIDDLHLVWFYYSLDRTIYKEQKIAEQIYHTHTMIEFFYCKSGILNVFFKEQSVTVNENEFILIAPNISHYTDIISDKPTSDTYVMSLSFYSNGLIVQHPLYRMLKCYLLDRPYYKGEKSTQIYEVIERMSCYESEDMAIMSATCIHEIILIIYNQLIKIEDVPDYQRFLADSTASRSVKIENVFSQLFMYPVTITQLAYVLNISTRQLSRIIMNQYGCTYHEKLKSVRVESAKGLLARTDFNMKDIANMTGFPSDKQFYYDFKSVTGFTPLGYRKHIKTGNMYQIH